MPTPSGMYGYRDAYRRGRDRNGDRRDNGGDAIAMALTLQIILCLLLIIAFVIYKNASEESYGDFKKQYAAMTTDQGQSDGVTGFVRDAQENLSGAAEAVEQFFLDLLGRILPVRKNSPAEEPPATPEEDFDEPATDRTHIPSFDYNYLGDPETALYTGSQSDLTGQGGWNPVPLSVASDSERLPPTGSTLSRVVSGAWFQPPVTGPITSVFGYREHPVTETDDFHTGMDIAAPEGSSILAALPGEVAEVGESRIYGNYIVLKHATNLMTSYSHCSEIIAREGMSVRQGERIAKVGQTGVVTGPHLHFGVQVEGMNVDPWWVLKDNISVVEE